MHNAQPHAILDDKGRIVGMQSVAFEKAVLEVAKKRGNTMAWGGGGGARRRVVAPLET